MFRRARQKWSRATILRWITVIAIVLGLAQSAHLLLVVSVHPSPTPRPVSLQSPMGVRNLSHTQSTEKRWVEQLFDFANDWTRVQGTGNVTVDNEFFCRDLREHVWSTMAPASGLFTGSFLEAVSKQWRRHQAVQQGHPFPNQKYIVWSLSGGLGNRFQSLASTFVAAVLSDRVLLLKDWFTPLPPNSKHNKPLIFPASYTSDYQMEALQKLFWFSNPQIVERGPRDPNDWLLCPLLPMMSLTDFETQYPQEFRAGGNRSKLVPSFKEGHVKIDIAARHDKQLVRWNRLACRNMSHSFDEPFVYIWTNQYYLPLFFSNPSHSQQLRLWFPRGEPFRRVSKLLVLPSLFVMELVLHFFQEQKSSYPSHPLTPGTYESLQIRAFSFAEMDRLGSGFEMCYSRGAVASRPFLLASMHQSIVDRFRSRGKDPTLVRTQSNKAAGDQLTGKGSSPDQEALADIILLALSKKLFVSPGSTFGTFAASFGDLNAVRVNWKQKDSTKDISQVCETMPSREPCFMSWYRYDHLFQRSSLGLGSVPREGITCPLAPLTGNVMYCK